MADLHGFIKIDRSILTWRWFKTPKTLSVWLWLLNSANFMQNSFEGDTIKPGEVATSIASIALGTNLTVNEVRTALKHLKSTGEITSRKGSHYQVITIINWNKYQNLTSKSTGRSQADHNHLTGRSQQRKNDKNGEEGKNIYSSHPTVSDVEQYATQEGLTIDAQSFVDYNESRGWSGIIDWRPLVKLRARQEAQAAPRDDDGLDQWGKPIQKEFSE